MGQLIQTGTSRNHFREGTDVVGIDDAFRRPQGTMGDTGFGIPEEELGRIFDRFYRVKNEKTRYIAGTGLGLAIVKSIVEAHNGMIEIESRIDHGTTFYIYLPIITS